MNLSVSEVFFSLNGEGLLMGIPTVFVRLSGCNLRCSWCDTPYAWEKGTEKSVKEVYEAVKTGDNGFCWWVLLTGGEPLLQDVEELIDLLQPHYRIGVETNGSLYERILERCDFISVDVKPPSSSNPTEDIHVFKKIIHAIEKRSGQVKAVIADENDYRFVKTFVEENTIKVPVVLQPCWGKMDYTELCALYFKTPIDTRNVRILTQIHKLGGIK